MLRNRDKRKVCVVLVDRANYGRMKPVMRAIQSHPQLTLQTICTGTMLLGRFGAAVQIVEKDGFRIDSRIYMEIEGSVPTTMAKSIGFATIEFASEIQRLQPDILVLIGDRYEALAGGIAAAYQNIPIAHIQGGEVSGSIDECARHAITKFAHFHFPATVRAASYLVRMGEDPATVFNYGCPVGDYISQLQADLPEDLFSSIGVGADLSVHEPFFLVIFHPVTTEFGLENRQVEELLHALHDMQHPAVWLWPNIDAGADHISKCLRVYREQYPENTWLHLIKNLTPEIYQKVLKTASCAIGNSSSFIRDTSFSGTPVVLIGNRQDGREAADNVQFVQSEKMLIMKSIKEQIAHGRYAPSNLYGIGNAASQIAEELSRVKLYVQKRLHYIYDSSGISGQGPSHEA